MSDDVSTVTEPDVPAGGGHLPPADRGHRHWWNWWQGSHPTFAALTGFYAGLVFIILVPGLATAILAWVFGQEKAEDYFPYVLITLVVPLALLIPRKTRRFAEFVWLGIVSTFVVVVGVASLVLWILIEHA
ncbi:hypothetical protein [Nocardioides sp. KR10-350]|uniref:hypothetical protein n=1 Tax=Nocardioides cheoyonin TaxID=3156615 RepID=UPI0032B3716B